MTPSLQTDPITVSSVIPLQYQEPSGTGHTSWLHLLLRDYIGSEVVGSGWPGSTFGMKGIHSWTAAPLSLPEHK